MDGPVETAVLDRLRDVLRFDRTGTFEMSDCARHPQDRVVGSRREAEAIDRLMQDPPSRGRERWLDVVLASSPRGSDTRGEARGRFPGRGCCVIRDWNRRHLHLDLEAIEKWS